MPQREGTLGLPELFLFKYPPKEHRTERCRSAKLILETKIITEGDARGVEKGRRGDVDLPHLFL